MIMTEYLKSIIIVHFALAILILPSSAFVVCNCLGEDLDCGNFSSQCEAQTWYEYCRSPGKDDVYDLDGYDKDGIVCEDRPAPYCSPPVAYDGNVTITKDIPVEITLHATDPDGDTMTYRIGPGPLYGTLGNITGNQVVYIPEANFTGIDWFGFSASDGNWDSNTATVTITVGPDCSLSQAFYGNVTINGQPAPEYTIISAAGPGIRSNITGNPVATQTDGSYGSANVTAQKLLVQGCIEDGTPLAFSVDGVQAEVCEVNTRGPWQSTCPFRAGEVTNLDIRVTPTIPPPDTVYINAIGLTVSNPWVELRVTRGVFDIQISATGYHDFRDFPLLGRNATLGIYENGSPVSSEVNVAFGSRTASYEYVATETRIFDILIYVNERPEIRDGKQITIYVGPDRYNITPTASTEGSLSPAGQVFVDAGALKDLISLPSTDIRSLMGSWTDSQRAQSRVIPSPMSVPITKSM
jgi:hypothetical protein